MLDPNSFGNFIGDVHVQFAGFFPEESIRPFAYLLSRRLLDGHVCIREQEVLEDPKVKEYFTVEGMPDWNGLHQWVGQPDGEPRPFVRTPDGRLYLHRYHWYETLVVRQILQRIQTGLGKRALRQAALEEQGEFIRSLGITAPKAGEAMPEQVIDWQLIGALNCLLSDFSILTGGPGTGKTTTLSKLLKIFYAVEPNAEVRLAAPTGKAATRMLETLGRSVQHEPEDLRSKIAALQATTIHRLLGGRAGEMSFKYNASNKLTADLIVVDEASMVDIPMMARLLDALSPDTRLILLGDRNQLASVEAGSLLGDLCGSVGTLNRFTSEHAAWLNGFLSEEVRRIPPQHTAASSGTALAGSVVELRYSHRFQQQGEIGKVASIVVNGDTAGMQGLVTTRLEDQLRFVTGDIGKALEEFARGYMDFIEEKNILEALRKLNALRVLVTVREGNRGLEGINRQIEKFLESKGKLKIDQAFYEHRPVLVTRNNYDFNLTNGDVGIVRTHEGTRYVWFVSEAPGEIRKVLPAYLSDAETNFAMTIHKSQGSEYDRVMVVLPDEVEHPLLTRELLYTGLTRARKSVVIAGREDVLLRAVSQGIRRTSGILDQLAVADINQSI